MVAPLGVGSFSMSGDTVGRGGLRKTAWSSTKPGTIGCGLHLVGRERLTSFLSLQPGLHGVLWKQPPASNENAPGHVLSPGELVADGARLQTEGVGELLDRV